MPEKDMWTWIFLWLQFMALLVRSVVIPAVPSADERYNFFNVDLLQAVNEQNDGNVIVSPASAKLALTILLEGARGLTQKQLLAALRLPDDVETIRIIAQRTFMPLKNIRNGTEIDVTSRLWVASGLRIVDNYNTILKQYYGGDIQTVDFNNSQNAAKIINDWVKIATRNKIESITEPGSLNSDTRLILTSALYFKGKWLKSFDKKATYVQCFNVPGQGCRNINFMQNIGVYRYAFIPSLNAKVIEIPYSDGKTSMIVLLPNDEQTDQNLQILSKDLSYVPMSALLANLKTSEVILIFPKFSIESKLDLRPALERMGIQDVFRTTANLSRIISDEPLHVSTILQNAKIEVDEEGTIAAAVTEISIVPLMGITLPIFRANRPFIFAIVDLQTNGTLFAGRFIRPNMSF